MHGHWARRRQGDGWAELEQRRGGVARAGKSQRGGARAAADLEAT
jgi:hypothetical protein